MQATKSNISYLLNKYDLTAKKRFGQNFLVEPMIVNKIIDKIDTSSIVVEIGPGLGSLTSSLAQKAQKVIAYEIDKDLCRVLDTELGEYENLEIINFDFLKVNIEDIYAKYQQKLVVVSNLPYYITSELIEKLIDNNQYIDYFIVMLQKEAAIKFLNINGEHTALHVLASYYYKIQHITKVNHNNFMPSPKVDSEVLLFSSQQPKEKAIKESEFKHFLIAAFSQPRKKVTTNLTNNGYHINTQQLYDINIEINIRADQLKLEDFLRLYEVTSHDEKSLCKD